MKPRQMLVLLLVLSLCSVAMILWKTRPFSEPALAANPLQAESTDSPDSGKFPSTRPVDLAEPAFSNSIPVMAKIDNPPSVAVYTTEELLEKIRTALGLTNDADRDEVFTNLLPALLRQDAKAAAQLADSLDPGPLREEMLRRVAQAWAEQDADRACGWAAQLTDRAERDSALKDVCLQLGQTDPGKALTLAGAYGVENGDDLKENLVQRWAEKDWVAALTWVNANPGAELQQDQRLARLALVLSKTSPMEAANMVVGSISPGFTQTEAAISVLHQWSLQDLAGARAWVEQFPTGEIRQRGEQELNGIAAYLKATNRGQ